MAVHNHLPHVMQIMRAEPNWRRWGELIDKLPDETREECREWLRQEARKRQLHEKAGRG